MKRYLIFIFSVLLGIGLILGSSGAAFSQEAENEEAFLQAVEDMAADEEGLLQLGDGLDDDYRAFAQTGYCLWVLPEKLRVGPWGRFALTRITALNGRRFERGEIVDWGTDYIVTLIRLTFPRAIWSLVWVMRDIDQDTYTVTVGNDDNCTGIITIIRRR